MPDTPTALPDRDKVRALIRERGYEIGDFARKIGRPPGTIYKITGHPVPRRIGLKILREVAEGLSTPDERIQVRDISDWPFADPEPKALASLDANKGPPGATGGR